MNDILDGAVRLIVRAETLKPPEQHLAYLQAGKVFESLISEKPEPVPLRFLAMATYQLANQHYKALEVATKYPLKRKDSRILDAFLKRDFTKLLKLLVKHWSKNPVPDNPWYSSVDNIIGCLGILCSSLKEGRIDRLDKAEKSFKANSTLWLDEDPYDWLLAYLCSQLYTTYITRFVYPPNLDTTWESLGAHILLLRDFNLTSELYFRVFPVKVSEEIYWLDPAGYKLAVSPIHPEWKSNHLGKYNFRLNVLARQIEFSNQKDKV
jgi:hypothetical protein